MTSNNLELMVVKSMTLRNKTPMVIGVIKAGDLVQRYRIPRRNFREKTGYQREVSPTRVSQLVKDLTLKRVDLPTAVLLNMREFDSITQLINYESYTVFKPLNGTFHVVDGQHRIEALAVLVNLDSKRWGDYEIPFVCMLGADEKEEMEQFYVVNSTAKSVRTDLALDLLKQRAESNPEIYNALYERGEAWKVRAQGLTEDLAKTTLWRGRIRFPSIESDGTTISSGGMVGSLKNILATSYFERVSPANQVRILDAYWMGIRDVLTEVFDLPEKYTLQKATGVTIMHELFTTVIEIVRSKGLSVTEPDSYRNILKNALLNLEGDTALQDTARGADFWLTGEEGAAGSYSSNAGRRVLLAKLRGLLPELEVE